MVPFGKVVEDEEFEIADGDKVLLRAIVSTNDVVMGGAPEDVGEMVVRMVVTSCDGLVLLLDVEDVAWAADCVVVDDCAQAPSAPKSRSPKDLTRIERVVELMARES